MIRANGLSPWAYYRVIVIVLPPRRLPVQLPLVLYLLDYSPLLRISSLPQLDSFAMANAEHDPLLLLRKAISSSQPFVPSASDDPGADESPLAQATHLQFSSQGIALAIDTPTRFISNDKPVDLRSIYFAWLNRELAIPEYNASATTLNDQLAAAGSTGKVQNLGFIERLDLITWLEGASEESEYIKPVAGDADAAGAGAAPAFKPGAASTAAQARAGKGTLDPRLASVYDGERRMGDRNTVLRGIKPTVCIRTHGDFFPLVSEQANSRGGK